MVALYPYQIDGGNFLFWKKQAILADEPGVGKTYQALLAAKLVAAEQALRQLSATVGIICPASAVPVWQAAIDAMGLRDQANFVVTSYNRAVKELRFVQPDVLILDEAHYLKTRDSKRTWDILGVKCDGESGVEDGVPYPAGIIENVPYIFALTGTPTPNNPAELWPLLRALAPGALIEPAKNDPSTPKPMSYWQFVSRFCKTKMNFVGRPQITGGKNIAKLKAAIAPYVLRRTKADVLPQLPPIRFDTLPLAVGKIPPAVSKEWDRVATVFHVKGVEGLRELAPHVAELRRLTGLLKVAPVLSWLDDWFEGGGGKIVLFAHHKDVIAGLAEGFGAVTLDGSSSPKQRADAVDRFQNDPACKLFVGQLQAAGTAITLTAASDVLIVEPSWVPSDNEQAAMRCHRIGQRNAVLVRYVSISGSIDDRISRALVDKARTITELWAA